MSAERFHGLLVVDKPVGITSRDAVDRAAAWFPPGTKIGHTGTLDPLASGVLVLCVGSATRLTEYVQAMSKTYRTVFTLGARSATDDAEGPITRTDEVTPPSFADVESALGSFHGEIQQTPPAFSAAKSKGRRAYALARRGDPVDLASRGVQVHRIEILNFDYPSLELEIRCGKGTYIRSIARDLGERLQCGGYVAALRRTRIGEFSANGALSMNAESADAQANLLPMLRALSELPHVQVADDDVARLRNGMSIASAMPSDALEVAVVQGGSLVAIACPIESGRGLRPVRVFPVE